MASTTEGQEASRTGPAESDMTIAAKAIRAGPAQNDTATTGKGVNRTGPEQRAMEIAEKANDKNVSEVGQRCFRRFRTTSSD
jgi:hypothetical protein